MESRERPARRWQIVAAALLFGSLAASSVGAAEHHSVSRRDKAEVPVLYAETFAKPAKLNQQQELRIVQLSHQVAPLGARVWFTVVSGPGCFAGDRIQVFYLPTKLTPTIRRGEMAYLGLVTELQDDTVERPIRSYAQVPPHGRTFGDSVDVPRLRDIPFGVSSGSTIDDELVVDAVSMVRERDRSFRRRHLGSLILEGDKVTVTTGYDYWPQHRTARQF